MNLETNYLGLTLRNPVVASAGPLSQTPEAIKKLGDAGVGAVVVYSLFEEQFRRDHEALMDIDAAVEGMFMEASSIFPDSFDVDPAHSYLDLISEAKKVSEVPVIASLNGVDIGSWIEYAGKLEEAGADALELNVYLVPGDMTITGKEVEQRHLQIAAAVKEVVNIPVAMKLSPYFSSVGQISKQLDLLGVDGLVLFNRFMQPDIDIERMEVKSGVTLSHPSEALLPRTWIAILRGRVKASLAATTGVETADDVVKYILAGADVVMTTSSLVRNGVEHAGTLVSGLEKWLDSRGLTLDKARGMFAVPNDVEAARYERASYVEALQKAKETYGSLKTTLHPSER